MTFELTRLKTKEGRQLLDERALQEAMGRLRRVDGLRLARLWAYYRNPMRTGRTLSVPGNLDRPYRQAQEWGLPSRITGVRSTRDVFGTEPAGNLTRKEVVIENDIGWRIDAMVDYLFGKAVVIRSAAPDESRRQMIDSLIRAIVGNNGGILFLQQLALLGAVYGFVDVLVKLDQACLEQAPGGGGQDIGSGMSGEASVCCAQDLGEPPVGAESARGALPRPGGESVAGPAQSADQFPPAPGAVEGPPRPGDDQSDTGASKNSLEEAIARLARMVRLEIVEPARALPFLSRLDYRIIDGYAQCFEVKRETPERSARVKPRGRWWQRLLESAEGWWSSSEYGGRCADGETVLVTEIITRDRWQRYEDEVLVAEGINSLGEIPLVHIQNTAVPFEYSGGSDVEGLIPLQDELNTRLSDRASRITLQSFKMYLGKGIENFTEMPVAPGRMWTTENEHAGVVEFGGDAASPSESAHIADIREAMDKASGVSPIAAGAIKDRIGRLTSAAALRVTLISLLARTDKKRTSYGMGLQRMIELSLAWLDKAGLFHTAPEERRVELHWPSPLPENELESLQEAEIKARLGVPREVVLKELGY